MVRTPGREGKDVPGSVPEGDCQVKYRTPVSAQCHINDESSSHVRIARAYWDVH